MNGSNRSILRDEFYNNNIKQYWHFLKVGFVTVADEEVKHTAMSGMGRFLSIKALITLLNV